MELNDIYLETLKAIAGDPPDTHDINADILAGILIIWVGE